MRPRRGPQTRLFVLTDTRRRLGHARNATGGSFNDAGLDTGVPDPFGDLTHIHLGDIIRPKTPEMRRDAQGFVVQAGGNDDVQPGPLGAFGGEFRVTA